MRTVGYIIVVVLILIMFFFCWSKDIENDKLLKRNRELSNRCHQRNDDVLKLEKENSELRAVIDNFGLNKNKENL